MPSSSLCAHHRLHKICILGVCRFEAHHKMPAFSFSMVRSRNAWQICLKRSPFAGKNLPNYFIQPSLLLSGGMIIFSLATKGSLIMFSIINAHGISSCPRFSFFAHWAPGCSTHRYNMDKFCGRFSGQAKIYPLVPRAPLFLHSFATLSLANWLS